MARGIDGTKMLPDDKDCNSFLDNYEDLKDIVQ